MSFKRFEDILAWQQARTLVTEIYNITSNVEPLRRDLKLTDKMQSASVGIMSHIARGFSTQNPIKFSESLYDSLACATEVQSLLYVCADLEKIDRRVFERISQMNGICIRMLNELINLLNKKIARPAAGARVPVKGRPGPDSDTLKATDPMSLSSADESPTRRTRAYSQPPAKSKGNETGEFERPNLVSIQDYNEILDPRSRNT